MSDSPDRAERARQVEAQFTADRLLARAMSPINIARDGNQGFKLDFESVWDFEVGAMSSERRLQNVSTTLLVPNRSVPTYKTYGFLMNGETAEIVHVAASDSGSSVSRDGALHAAHTDLKTLSNLASQVREKNPRTMNEVNAHFKDSDVLGLFVVKAMRPQSKLDAVILQRHLKENGLDLPLFEYGHDGTLTELTPSNDEIAGWVLGGLRGIQHDVRVAELGLGTEVGLAEASLQRAPDHGLGLALPSANIAK